MDILIEEMEGSLWAAALDQGRLGALEVDPPYEEVRWGSLYWAKVKTIDKAQDAVFLDLDGENTGILYNGDTRSRDKSGKIVKGGAQSIAKSFKPGDFVAVQAKTAYLPRSDEEYTGSENKIPQMSMDITIPGRYLIYCAHMDCNRISQRIRDKTTRKNMRAMLDALQGLEGFILRNAAANTQTDMLIREAKILKEMWDQVQDYFTGEEAGLIMLGPDAVQRLLSDQADKTVDSIEVVTMDHYTHAEEWCDLFAPDLVTKIEPVELEDADQDLALFHYRDIIGQIEDLFQSYALLSGGGNVIIQQTAALTAIDVKKGGDKKGHLNTNLEAAAEIARQLRLRNAGGIVMIDFLPFKSKSEEGKVIAALEDAFAEDPCTVQIHGPTSLGLIEITRKRRTPPLEDRLEGFLE